MSLSVYYIMKLATIGEQWNKEAISIQSSIPSEFTTRLVAITKDMGKLTDDLLCYYLRKKEAESSPVTPEITEQSPF